MGFFFSSSKPLSLRVGNTGKDFVEHGPSGFRAQFFRLCHEHKTSLANLSEDDKELLYSIIVDRIRKKVPGSKISSYDRKLMRMDAQKAFHEGKLSKEDLQDFSRIVVGLDK